MVKSQGIFLGGECMLILTPEQIRSVEAKADSAGLSYLRMMEKAGRGCAEYILKNCRNARNIVILVGKGKNGGDGFVIARHLYNACKFVTVIKLFDKPSDTLSESRRNELSKDLPVLVYSRDKSKCSEAILNADVVVDAVFGIGFSGALPEDVKEAFGLAENTNAKKIAVDLPSGVSVDGIADGAFKADVTLSMLCYKREHVYKPFADMCGKTEVIPIGINISSDTGIFTLTESEIKSRLPERPFNSNKGTFGKAAIIAGSYKMPGAAVLAAKGAISCGAGLVCMIYPDVCRDAICNAVPECVNEPLETAFDGTVAAKNGERITEILSGCDAAAVGCGLGVTENTEAVLDTVLRTFDGTLIIDADGINILAKNPDILKNTKATVAITPHPGEMGRLMGMTPGQINDSREKAAVAFAKKYGVYVLLKGVNTVIADPDGRVYVNTSGSTALSRGGSGDLLTGMITSLCASGVPIFDALIVASYLHGKAGECAAEKYTPYAASTARIAECIGEAFLSIKN